MSNDFEVHERGTAAELKASRELATAIQEDIEELGEQVFSKRVLQAHKRLYNQYVNFLRSEEC